MGKYDRHFKYSMIFFLIHSFNKLLLGIFYVQAVPGYVQGMDSELHRADDLVADIRHAHTINSDTEHVC